MEEWVNVKTEFIIKEK